ncbi:MAG: RNA 2',3'-cyclic phosphodiesterase [Candidatus Omnitrophica bacterium]|nr:RNA 2',3'-cyclic phosphodiesterase [Candidatus Omnitrophota bacterium]MDD5770676.1 RNA 2',3'-cyclic phosphodiesterase [Candidatus Omnitrophota bacterium]
MRAFIAVEIPEEIKDGISGMPEKADEYPGINWVKPQNLHLTLKFLGEISSGQIEEVKKNIALIAKSFPPFRVKLEKSGVFPHLREARIIWIGPQRTPEELKSLFARLETEILQTNALRQERSFHAHVTVGRIKKSVPAPVLQKIIDGIEKDLSALNCEFDCKEITLFESTLNPQGPVYTAIGKFNLNAS